MPRAGDDTSSGVLIVRCVGGPGEANGSVRTELHTVGSREGPPTAPLTPPRVDGVLVLTDADGSSGVLIVDGTVRTLAPSSIPVIERLEHEMEPVRRARVRADSRRASVERLLLTAERIARGTGRDTVVDAALEGATDVVGGFGALYWDGGRWHGGARLTEEGSRLPGIVREASRTPALRTRASNAREAGPESPWRELFHTTSAESMACVPLGQDGLLAIVERRATRVFEPEAWDGLRAVARHAEVALDRLELRRAAGADRVS